MGDPGLDGQLVCSKTPVRPVVSDEKGTFRGHEILNLRPLPLGRRESLSDPRDNS